MGEAPAFFSNDCETAASIGNKTYLIGGDHDDDDDAISIKVQIFDRSIGEMVDPIVLGTKPKSSQGLSAIAISTERILVMKRGSDSNECVWFLEVDTPFVEEQRKALGSEVVAWSKGVRGGVGKPIVISGPSGVGKGTLISMLMKEFPSMFGFSISHTTRPPRNGEKNGVHYHFTKRSLMEDDIKEGKFLEFASVHGNLYGTSIESVELVADEGKRCILDIDVQGARSVRASSLEAIFIFICPPSMVELEKRLRSRRTETDEQILKRLHNAKAEIELGQSSNIFDYVMYNDNLHSCYGNLKKFLGLDDCLIRIRELESNGFDIPIASSISMVDNKIIITSETNNLEEEPKNESRNLIVLSLSSLTGGAPGRTQGVDFYSVDRPFST